MPVTFHEQLPVKLIERKRLKAFISTIFKSEKSQLNTLSIIFCSDNYLKTINKKFLNHNYNTDIITFDLSPFKSPGIVGEVYISAERVIENSIIYGVPFNHELHRVIFHGVLHLCGYTDKSAKSKGLMRSKEDFYLNLFFKGST